jgi:hypothetical protein
LSGTYNFISQTVADQLSLEAAVKQKLLPITTINGEPLHAIPVIHNIVCMWDSTMTKQSHAINFVVADITYLDVIIVLAWLLKQHPDI